MTTQPVAVITAASKGMGAACARELAARGYRTALMARSEAVIHLAGEIGGIGVTGSVTDPEDLKALFDLALERFGRIDAVVNNTGHPPKGDLLQISDSDWVAGCDLVLMNVVRTSRLAVPIMEAQGGGSITNISTFAAFEPSLTFPVSSTFRAALAAFAKLFADRYARANIRMNNVLPGFIDSYEIDVQTRETIPMGRAGTVAEVARTVAFLVSSESSYITGQNLRVDGGLARSI